MSGARPISGLVAPFCLCVVASAIGVAITFLATSDAEAGPARMTATIAVALVAMPVVAVAGVFAALLERGLLPTLPLLPYLALSAVVAAGAGWAFEHVAIPKPYEPGGAFILPAIVAGLIAASLWHILVRKRKVLTHG